MIFEEKAVDSLRAIGDELDGFWSSLGADCPFAAPLLVVGVDDGFVDAAAAVKPC